MTDIDQIMVHMTEQTDFAAVPKVTLGWRIQMALDHAGLKQTDLMEKFEISRGTASRWCRGAHPAPKKFILNEIAVMCGVSARWLIDGEDTEPDPDGGNSSSRPDLVSERSSVQS
ncbi:helix-turn-helix domain-containing protein [Williamsia sp.]|uniref:helix-turn-helix domain-containing protein n=1 Tax=Williamsia sp. TaxID=1872085 RepID=UPI002F938956